MYDALGQVGRRPPAVGGRRRAAAVVGPTVAARSPAAVARPGCASLNGAPLTCIRHHRLQTKKTFIIQLLTMITHD